MKSLSNSLWWLLAILVPLWVVGFLLVVGFGNCFGSVGRCWWPFSMTWQDIGVLLFWPLPLWVILAVAAFGIGWLADRSEG